MGIIYSVAFAYHYLSGITGVSGQTLESSLYPQGAGIEDPFP